MKTEKAKWMTLFCAVFLLAVLPQESTASWITDLIFAQVQQARAPSPILIFPGLMGSQLEVKDDTGGFFCKTRGKYKLVWIGLLRFWNCERREIRLQYDSKRNIYYNTAGVDIRPVDFGGTKGVEYLTNNIVTHPWSKYLHTFVEFFVKHYNYKRGKNIRAAPYDWRLAADELEKHGYYDQVKRLVEEMYMQNGQRKVTIVAHSMGGPVSHHFLTRYSKMTQQWKDRYINAYVPLAGAWSGGNRALHVIITGLGAVMKGIPLPHWIAEKLSNATLSLESTYWMMPRQSVWRNTPLVRTPSKTYTAGDYQELFQDLGVKNGYAKYQGVIHSSPNFPPPNVPTHCFYGVGINTEELFYYKNDFKGKLPLGEKPQIRNGDGDGTVNVNSSEMCLAWRRMAPRYPFEYKTFYRLDHMQIVQDYRIFNEIAKIVGATWNMFNLF